MESSLPEDLRDHLLAKPTLTKKQRAMIRELASECADGRQEPGEMAARYVRRSVRSGWARSESPDSPGGEG